MLQGRDVALDRADADLERPGETLRGASPGARAAQFLAQRVEAIGSIHP